MATELAQHHRRSGGAMTVIDVFDTRPGGPNRQERAHRVGAPESPAEEIEEMGMLQVHTCVSVHCDQCGEPLGDPEIQGHYPSEDAALNAAATQRWRATRVGGCGAQPALWRWPARLRVTSSPLGATRA
ncbi:MAG: hypothetical protein WCF33_17415, partial [Pseudonocardiaceae bacterium]